LKDYRSLRWCLLVQSVRQSESETSIQLEATHKRMVGKLVSKLIDRSISLRQNILQHPQSAFLAVTEAAETETGIETVTESTVEGLKCSGCLDSWE